MQLLDTVRFGALSSVGCVALLSALSSGSTVLNAAAASPVAGSNSGQLFGVHPALEGSTTLPGGHFNFALLPGKSIADGIVIANFSDHALTFHVYGADLLKADGGGLAPAQRTATMHEVGAWIVVSEPTTTIPAHSQFTDAFTMTLPMVVAPGEHIGAVVAAADVGVTPQGSAVEARTALITVVSVPGFAQPSATLGTLSASTVTTGRMRFGVTLSNTGNVLLTYTGSVVVNDGRGHRVATLPLTPVNAYVVPGGQVPLAAEWKDFAVDSDRYRAQATVTILAAGSPVTTLTSQSLALPYASDLPIAIVAGSALVVIGISLAAWFIRRHVRRRLRRVARARSALAGRLRSQT